jgi:hypothetical protein
MRKHQYMPRTFGRFLRTNGAKPLASDRNHAPRFFSQMPRAEIISLITLAVCASAITLSELTGYYWLVSMNGAIYISFDKRPLRALAFGVMAGAAMSLLIMWVFSRKGLLPAVLVRIFSRLLPVIIVFSWSFLVLSYAENLIYPEWIVADSLVFFVTLGALTWRKRLSRRNRLAAFVLALAVSLSLAVPGYMSATRTALWAAPLGCELNRCPFGLVDPTLSGPSREGLVQGRTYDFYFDVIQGRVAVMLTSAPGAGNTTYWSVGGSQGLSNWNGVGVYEFEWSPGTAAFYQLVFLNQNYPSGSLIVTRVTIA